MIRLYRSGQMETGKVCGLKACIGAAAAAGIALAVGQALAVENADLRLDSTSHLYAVCSVPASAPEYPVTHHACRAFIEGVAQYHDLISKPGKLSPLFCMPAGSTIDQAVAAFGTWAADKKGDARIMGEPPALGVVRALAAKYPCKG